MKPAKRRLARFIYMILEGVTGALYNFDVVLWGSSLEIVGGQL